MRTSTITLFSTAILLMFMACQPKETTPCISDTFIYAAVDFADSLQPWDGFGVNYVQSAQWRGFDTAHNEDYGGFSQLSDEEQEEIMQLIFGADGLQPSLIKMFLDPYHEGRTIADNDNDDPFVINSEGFDHQSTTTHMRRFVKQGLQMTREQGRDLEIITTLYGPAPWMTKQKFVRGRDLDTTLKYELAEYMISWVKYLREEEDLPVNYLSFHNEGENNDRWDTQALTPGEAGHDHNLWWPKEQIIDFLHIMPQMLQKHGLEDIRLATGECVSWGSMVDQEISQAIASDDKALQNLGLITSHSFSSRVPSAVGIIRAKKQRQHQEYLHAWVSSTSFVRMYIDFLYNFHHEIYSTKVNAIIPWAPIQVKDMWIGGEPNQGCAIWVTDSSYQIRSGYYFLKTFMRAGYAGMNVVKTSSSDDHIFLTAFAQGQSQQPDAFNVLNVHEQNDKSLTIDIEQSQYKSFKAYRTSMEDNYKYIGEFMPTKGRISYTAPTKSSTTFIGQ